MTAPLRRTPTQDRSRQRVARILDVAAHVFAEVGYEAATTEAIAERAGVSIGSLYQFFPNKKALFEAIGARYLEQARQLFEGLVTPDRLARPWQELLDGLVDGFWGFHRTSPGFQAVWKGFLLSPEFLVAGDALNREIARRLDGVLAHFTGLPKKQREVVATALVESLSALLSVGARMREPRASMLKEESKVLLRRYLEPYMRRDR